MIQITQTQFEALMATAGISPRVRREVRFVKSVDGLAAGDWEASELVPITTRADNTGVLLLSAGESSVYVAYFSLARGIKSSSGRVQAIICDFCRTWQVGGRSGTLTLDKPGRGAGSVTFLCCADLQCSRHVRNLTSAAKTSRAQLREDLTVEQRVERLRGRIVELVSMVGLQPYEIK